MAILAIAMEPMIASFRPGCRQHAGIWCQRSRPHGKAAGNVHGRSAGRSASKLTAELFVSAEPDGELTPTVTFVDELLASKSEEPTMRDA
jgi:hypothetical protein